MPVMTRFCLAFSALVAATNTANAIDCGIAATKVEITICDTHDEAQNKKMLALDVQLNAAYAAALKAQDTAGKELLRTEQRAWQAWLETRMNQENTAGNVESALRQRIEVLDRKSNHIAAEVAENIKSQMASTHENIWADSMLEAAGIEFPVETSRNNGLPESVSGAMGNFSSMPQLLNGLSNIAQWETAQLQFKGEPAPVFDFRSISINMLPRERNHFFFFGGSNPKKKFKEIQFASSQKEEFWDASRAITIRLAKYRGEYILLRTQRSEDGFEIDFLGNSRGQQTASSIFVDTQSQHDLSPGIESCKIADCGKLLGDLAANFDAAEPIRDVPAMGPEPQSPNGASVLVLKLQDRAITENSSQTGAGQESQGPSSAPQTAQNINSAAARHLLESLVHAGHLSNSNSGIVTVDIDNDGKPDFVMPIGIQKYDFNVVDDLAWVSNALSNDPKDAPSRFESLDSKEDAGVLHPFSAMLKGERWAQGTLFQFRKDSEGKIHVLHLGALRNESSRDDQCCAIEVMRIQSGTVVQEFGAEYKDFRTIKSLSASATAGQPDFPLGGLNRQFAWDYYINSHHPKPPPQKITVEPISSNGDDANSGHSVTYQSQ